MKCSAKHFIHIISFTSHTNLWIRYHYYACFTGKETEVHSVVTCLTGILLKTIRVPINWQWFYPQGVFDKPIPKKKKCKMVVWGGPTNSWVKKRSERQRRKGNMYPSECRVPKKSEIRKAFLGEQCKEIEENNRRLEISSRKLEIAREHCMQRWAQESTEMSRT